MISFFLNVGKSELNEQLTEEKNTADDLSEYERYENHMLQETLKSHGFLEDNNTTPENVGISEQCFACKNPFNWNESLKCGQCSHCGFSISIPVS